MKLSIRVVSYNVLSSHLASPTHFTTLLPEHLEARNRLPVVLNKLQDELNNLSKDTRCLFCLQEVSHDWAGAFHTFFANQGYHMVTGLYGKRFNGYMGIALAYPIDAFETVSVDISRLSDKRQGGWPRLDENNDYSQQQLSFTNTLSRLWKGLSPIVETPLRFLGLHSQRQQQVDPWEMSQNRHNILLTATLRDKRSKQTFCIANYHMPCAFYAPMVMTIHAEMAAKHVQSLAAAAAENDEESSSYPYIFAGDFNIKPTDSMYQLLTTGQLDKNDPALPTPKYGYEWTSTIKPMRSAYASSEGGGEPDFTNYARIQEDEPFIDTLDYIFISPEWEITGVKPLPNRSVANGPFPNLDHGEPSDHILMAASLECTTVQ